AANDQNTEHLLIGNLGGIYYQRGDIARAREQFNKSYDLYTRIGDIGGQARALSNIGLTEQMAGNLTVALRFYQRAELLTKKALVSHADMYRNSQAAIYHGLGDFQRARLLYQERERSAKVKGQKTTVSFVSQQLARIAKHDGRLDDARRYYTQSLDIEKELGNSSGVSIILLLLVELKLVRGELVQAGNYLDEVNLLLPQVETFRVRIWAEYINGKYLLKRSEFSAAIMHLESALNAYQTAGYRDSESRVHIALVDAYRGIGQLDRAEQHAKSAITLINEIRPENISMDLRASFSSRQRDAYEKLIDLYLSRWQEDKLELWSRKALMLSEQARAQTLRETASSSQSTGGLSSELQQQRRDLSDRLNALATLRLKAREKQQQEIVSKLNLQYTEALVVLENFDQKHLPESSDRLALTDLDIERQLAVLAQDNALLVIYLSEEASVLWVLAKGQLETHILPAKKQIEAKVQSILTALRRPGGYQLVKEELLFLGKALDPGLPAGVTTIRLTADGVLNYLPFVALAVKGNEGNYWLQRFNIINSPFIGDLSTGELSNPPDWQSLGILADPEYDQSEIKKNKSEIAMTYPHDLGLYRLRGSAVEAKTIAEIARQNFSEETAIEIFSGYNATRTEVLEGKITNADILHFATHGIFNNQGMALAGLALSVVDDQGKEQPWLLTAQELYQTPIAARLVVMSACDAGTGTLAAGEGLMGMVRGFMYAGVTDVVSSQWKVSDRAAVELMRGFYTALLGQNQSVSEALRQAQLNFVQSDSYNDPFYWAGFSNFRQ
ncbi:MAG: CHAT domain-containing protein, partial [Xanthomonadales bacterium]|nr:CHAT domain-containing protein [Xanthomonadales bacterium]